MLKNTIEYKRFVWELNNVIQVKNAVKKIIFLCIGTAEVIGDSFGPMVGTILKESFLENDKIEIIGDMENAVTYNIIEEKIKYIKMRYINRLIIVIDSALSVQNDVGKIFIQNRGLKYAESLKKQNRTIGDISIKAVVGKDEKNNIENFKNLKGVKVEQIQLMSYIVSKGIIDVMNKKVKNGKNIYK